MKLTVLTYNTLFAGRDGANDARAQAQIDLINQVRPDVFLMQEAKGFDANGGAWLYATEDRIGMRGFLAIAPRTGQNVAIFIREPLRPLAFDADGAHFHHALATLKVAVPGSSEPITFISAHLCPNGPEVRRREAAYLAVQAPRTGSRWSLATSIRPRRTIPSRKVSTRCRRIIAPATWPTICKAPTAACWRIWRRLGGSI